MYSYGVAQHKDANQNKRQVVPTSPNQNYNETIQINSLSFMYALSFQETSLEYCWSLTNGFLEHAAVLADRSTE